MPDDTVKPGAPEGGEQAFDRTAYLKEIRQELLEKLGLPKNTKPQQVAKLIQIKNDMEKIKNKQ
jgi:hypothetical protein